MQAEDTSGSIWRRKIKEGDGSMPEAHLIYTQKVFIVGTALAQILLLCLAQISFVNEP
jgi:hypothetical protein